MKKTNPKVDAFLSRTGPWRKETEQLRSLCLDCGLTEELKWGKPCYTFRDKNVVLIQGFKAYCALLFVKGALLKDPKGILNRIGAHTQAARQARFTELREVVVQEPALRACIREAVEAEKAGLQVVLKKSPEPIPDELQRRLEGDPALKTAFGALTPGRQRAHILYISSAKQSKTRESRIGACIPQILKGRGWNE